MGCVWVALVVWIWNKEIKEWFSDAIAKGIKKSKED